MSDFRHLEADSMEASALGRAPVHMIERKGCHMYYGVTNCKAVCNPALRAGICAAILFCSIAAHWFPQFYIVRELLRQQ